MIKLRNFRLKDISQYRTQLMGFSILEIMLFHCGAIPFGFIGVEFFLFVSALGLFFSLKKNADVRSFYKRRLSRIIPAYVILTIPYVLMFKYLYPKYVTIDIMLKIFFQIRALTGIYMWSQWFIALILICYAITPLFLRFKNALLSYKFLVVLTILCYTLGQNLPMWYIIERLPVFLFSLKFAEFIYDNQQISYTKLLIPVIISILYFIFILPWIEANDFTFSKYIFAFLLLTLPLIVLLTNLIKYLPIALNKILTLLGKISLELYLCHEGICIPLSKLMIPNFTGSWMISKPLSIVLAVILAYATHSLISYIMAKCSLKSNYRL